MTKVGSRATPRRVRSRPCDVVVVLCRASPQWQCHASCASARRSAARGTTGSWLRAPQRLPDWFPESPTKSPPPGHPADSRRRWPTAVRCRVMTPSGTAFRRVAAADDIALVMQYLSILLMPMPPMPTKCSFCNAELTALPVVAWRITSGSNEPMTSRRWRRWHPVWQPWRGGGICRQRYGSMRRSQPPVSAADNGLFDDLRGTGVAASTSAVVQLLLVPVMWVGMPARSRPGQQARIPCWHRRCPMNTSQVASAVGLIVDEPDHAGVNASLGVLRLGRCPCPRPAWCTTLRAQVCSQQFQWLGSTR